jgi:hypothetical protein
MPVTIGECLSSLKVSPEDFVNSFAILIIVGGIDKEERHLSEGRISAVLEGRDHRSFCHPFLHAECVLDPERMPFACDAFPCMIFDAQNSEISYQKQTGLTSCTLPSCHHRMHLP